MSRTRIGLLALGASFLVVLVLVTVRSTSTPLGMSPDALAAAERACRGSVLSREPGARFPHDASVETRPDDRLRLSGSVDSGRPSQSVRRNYECLVRRDPAAGFVVDSVLVWQSH